MESKETEVEISMGQQVSDLLSIQAKKIESLSRDLAKAYEKEIQFFENLEGRDREIRRLKKKIYALQRGPVSKALARVRRSRARHYIERVAPAQVQKASQLRHWAYDARKAVRSWR